MVNNYNNNKKKQLQLLILPWSHDVAQLQIVTYAVVEKGMEYKGEQR